MKTKLRIFEYARSDGVAEFIAARTLADAIKVGGESTRPLAIDRAYAAIAEAYMVPVVGLVRRKNDTAGASDFYASLAHRENT